MINKSILALIAVVAAAGVASSAFAQSFSRSEGTGNPLPSILPTGVKSRSVLARRRSCRREGAIATASLHICKACRSAYKVFSEGAG